MNSAARRTEILKIIYRRRFVTVSDLASETGVSARTVRRDIDLLSLTEPVYTMQGRYGGGVYAVEYFYPDRMYFRECESAVMQKILTFAENGEKFALSDTEICILKNLVSDYTKPTVKREN